MVSYTKEQFTRTVAEDYRARQYMRHGVSLSASGSVLASADVSTSLGHPAVQQLEVGQRCVLPLTVVFLDLTDFTGRTFWDDPYDVVDLAHAVLSGFIETVSRFGGHALGLRGDGLFAGFGGPPEFATTLALGACSFALDAVDNGVNSWLDEQRLEHVQARAGVDAGEITFIRTGTAEHSEVNALGFAANFAAKCEKKANSWEVIVGERARNALPDHPYFSAHDDSPKTYTRHGNTRYYRYYDFGWRRALPYLENVPEELLGASSSDVIGG